MLEIQLNRNRERLIAGTGGVSFEDLVTTVVIKADQGGWALDLIRGAIAAKPNNFKLKAFLARYPDWDPAANPTRVPGSCYQAEFMRGRRVFLKREGFRQALQETGVRGQSRV